MTDREDDNVIEVLFSDSGPTFNGGMADVVDMDFRRRLKEELLADQTSEMQNFENLTRGVLDSHVQRLEDMGLNPAFSQIMDDYLENLHVRVATGPIEGHAGDFEPSFITLLSDHERGEAEGYNEDQDEPEVNGWAHTLIISQQQVHHYRDTLLTAVCEAARIAYENEHGHQPSEDELHKLLESTGIEERDMNDIAFEWVLGEVTIKVLRGVHAQQRSFGRFIGDINELNPNMSTTSTFTPDGRPDAGGLKRADIETARVEAAFGYFSLAESMVRSSDLDFSDARKVVNIIQVLNQFSAKEYISRQHINHTEGLAKIGLGKPISTNELKDFIDGLEPHERPTLTKANLARFIFETIDPEVDGDE